MGAHVGGLDGAPLFFPLGGGRCLAGLVPNRASQSQPWRSRAKKESTPKRSYTTQCAKTTAAARIGRPEPTKGRATQGLKMKDLQPGHRRIIFTLAGGQCSHKGKRTTAQGRTSSQKTTDKAKEPATNLLAAKARVAREPLPRLRAR